jgi:tRNA threonylcarbamoyladenosine biosynthesis protein TsaB
MTGKPPTILAIETATSACSVALRANGSTRGEIRVEGRGQAEALVPAIAEVMARTGTGWPQIDVIAVGVGPGSFTGLRIGLAAARGLALARRLPVIGIGTAELLAYQVAAERIGPRTLLVTIDSKRDDVFVQPFSAEREAMADIRALTPEQALDWQTGPLLVAGDAAERFRGLRDDVEILPMLPLAAPLAALAEIRRSEGGGLPAHPLYVRPPDVTLPRRG